ncbi:hypothetical protein FHG87_019321, partial [Trinorchestia longiramus]
MIYEARVKDERQKVENIRNKGSGGIKEWYNFIQGNDRNNKVQIHELVVDGCKLILPKVESMSEEEWNSDNGSGGEEEDSTAHARLVADIDSIAKTKKQPKPSSGVRYSSMASGGVDLGALASLDRQVSADSARKEANPIAKQKHKR